MDWHKMRADLEQNMLFPGEIATQTLPLRYCTSRANGYNPTRLYIDGMFKQQFDIHPETDPVMYRFYGVSNVKALQQECQKRGWGIPAYNSMRYYMDLALKFDRGLFNATCVGQQNYQILVDEYVATLNQRVLAIIEPYIKANKFGYEQYYRDINQMRNIPAYPQQRGADAKRSDVPLTFPYYNSLE